jgi:RNA polymerase sigma factor (sigma-70 family)
VASVAEARRQGIRDARLVEAAREGDRRAFELLYERHHGPILSFCRHLTGRLEDAEDALQHTFLSAYREITASAGELDLKPWLFTVARNRCLSLLRARRLREGPGGAGLWTGRHMDGLAEEVERREDLRALVVDLGELPEPQRAALVLSELEALSHAQIAQVLHVDTAKVRSLVFQARGSLISTRDARAMPCGEIRFQLSTLRGPALRRRTLRRHVRACPGCREFELAVRRQHRDLAVILPVTAAAGLKHAALPSGLVGGAAGGGGVAAGGAMAGGGALAGGGIGGAGGGGLLGGVAAFLSGSGVAQLTAVAAVAATGTVGVAKTHVAERLGIADGGPRVERALGAPPSSPVAPGGRAGEPGSSGADARSEGDPPGVGGGGHGKATAPGQLKKGSDNGDVPPGLAKKDTGGVPPGLAKKGHGWTPPGRAHGKGGGTPPGHANAPPAHGNGSPARQGRPPAQNKAPAQNAAPGKPQGRGTRPAPSQAPKAPGPTANGQGSPPAHAPAGQADPPAKPTPPGQVKEHGPK